MCFINNFNFTTKISKTSCWYFFLHKNSFLSRNLFRENVNSLKYSTKQCKIKGIYCHKMFTKDL